MEWLQPRCLLAGLEETSTTEPASVEPGLAFSEIYLRAFGTAIALGLPVIVGAATSYASTHIYASAMGLEATQRESQTVGIATFTLGAVGTLGTFAANAMESVSEKHADNKADLQEPGYTLFLAQEALRLTTVVAAVAAGLTAYTVAARDPETFSSYYALSALGVKAGAALSTLALLTVGVAHLSDTLNQ
ncbi:MAG: hypothetical protein B7X06_03540 [Verrucomicrobia bacterium 21-51-4]|nr:MAG: hypothetical protein B7X06_03540 [Verrucomicrobia bacterium 21-51-4]HQU09642.1 hypothetical protein [Opitutales bacterium]